MRMPLACGLPLLALAARAALAPSAAWAAQLAAPGNFRVTATTMNSVTLAWEAQAGIAGYELQYKTASATEWQSVASGGPLVTTLNISGLPTDVWYDFRLRALSADGASPWAETAAHTTAVSSPPATPAGLSVAAVTETTASLSWTQQLGLSSYKLQYRVAGAPAWTAAPPPGVMADAATVHGLAADTAYEFRLRAVNNMGTSAWASASGATPPEPAPPAHARDFTGDGKADFLWRSRQSHALVLWRMDGAERLGTAALPAQADALWRVAAVGDFDGDGSADVLWRHATSHALLLWRMDGTALSAAAPVENPGAEWRVAAAADFNGDGKADVLWRHASGHRLMVWRMDGAAKTLSYELAAIPPGLWRVAGAADFYGTGKAAVLLQNRTTRQLRLWRLDGGLDPEAHDLTDIPDPEWEALDAADFLNTGHAAILLRNVNTHRLRLWPYEGEVRGTVVDVGAAEARIWALLPGE